MFNYLGLLDIYHLKYTLIYLIGMILAKNVYGLRSYTTRSLILVMLLMEQIIAVVGLVSATTEVAGAGPEQVVGDDGGSPADVTEGGAGSRHGAQNQQGTDAQLLHVR